MCWCRTPFSINSYRPWTFTGLFIEMRSQNRKEASFQSNVTGFPARQRLHRPRPAGLSGTLQPHIAKVDDTATPPGGRVQGSTFAKRGKDVNLKNGMLVPAELETQSTNTLIAGNCLALPNKIVQIVLHHRNLLFTFSVRLRSLISRTLAFYQPKYVLLSFVACIMKVSNLLWLLLRWHSLDLLDDWYVKGLLVLTKITVTSRFHWLGPPWLGDFLRTALSRQAASPVACIKLAKSSLTLDLFWSLHDEKYQPNQVSI